MRQSSIELTVEKISGLILMLRGQRVMLDHDLARLYKVPTKVLNQAVKRNKKRFPDDFMFQLTPEEKNKVVTICDHLKQFKFSPVLSYAFTEHSALMLANFRYRLYIKNKVLTHCKYNYLVVYFN